MRFPAPNPADRAALRRVLDAARQHGARGIAVFDLDSTLFDNVPRQARILREYGQATGLVPLQGCVAGHWGSGWDMQGAMRAAGLEEALVLAHFDAAMEFWKPRFYSGSYCLEDRPIAGAPAFVQAVREAGASVAYCTGRPEAMRAGSIERLLQCGFPAPGSESVSLIMKPSLDMGDDEFKRLAHAQLRELGTVFAAFDNEPTHINDYRSSFPAAHVVHLATDHSGREVAVASGIPAVVDFTMD